MRNYKRAAVGVMMSAAAIAPLRAQQLASVDTSVNAESLDAVVVLGTARKDITALTSTAPVDVITSVELQKTGAVTINEALSKLHPSFNFPQGQNAVKGQGVRAASLRGVGPGYTLVLVNGKRRNLSAQLSGTDPWPATQVVDINTIPLSAVERVEVLRDGAAAQYGSDAIAGVINIVLKTDASGGSIDARGGGYSDGGGETYQYLGTKGFKLGEDGFLNLNVDRLKNDNVDRSAADWRQLFPNGQPGCRVDPDRARAGERGITACGFAARLRLGQLRQQVVAELRQSRAGGGVEYVQPHGDQWNASIAHGRVGAVSERLPAVHDVYVQGLERRGRRAVRERRIRRPGFRRVVRSK